MYAVKLGNHRTVAVIVLTKKNKIMPHFEVGNIAGKALTAGQLVRLFDTKQLATHNTNFRGIAWVDETKIDEIVDNFDPAKLFCESRDGGLGIVLQPGGRISFSDVRVDFGHGELLTDYMKNKWNVA